MSPSMLRSPPLFLREAHWPVSSVHFLPLRVSGLCFRHKRQPRQQFLWLSTSYHELAPCLECDICELITNSEVTDISLLENSALRPGGRTELSARHSVCLTSAHSWGKKKKINLLTQSKQWLQDAGIFGAFGGALARMGSDVRSSERLCLPSSFIRPGHHHPCCPESHPASEASRGSSLLPHTHGPLGPQPGQVPPNVSVDCPRSWELVFC